MTVVWADVEIGDALREFEDEPLTVTDFVRYQGASGDMNPIHHDPAAARNAGYPEPFAVGMRQAGVMASYVARVFGPESVRRFKVLFREQAWPRDVITYSGKVVGKRVTNGSRLVDLELVAVRQTGGVHLSAWATCLMPA